MPDSDAKLSVSVRRVDGRGMITLRGSLDQGDFRDAVHGALGVGVPSSGQITSGKLIDVAWMSPDELLVLLPLEEVNTAIGGLSRRLKDHHHLVCDVSSLRIEFVLSGPVRDVLAKGTPADMSPRGLGVMQFLRTRLGQLQVAIWIDREGEAHVLCRCSESEFLHDWLSHMSRESSLPRYFHR